MLSAAHELTAIQHQSPIVTLALHRFVVAFLYAAFRGPRGVSDLRSILDKGRFDPAPIQEYATRVRERFWLFHPERPFMQDPRLPEELRDDSDAPSPIFQLFRETAAPAGPTLFDHTISSEQGAISAAEAARYLLADQFFGLQDGRGYTPSMLSFGAAVWVAGEDLFKTLALNLLPYNSERPIKSPDLERDVPFWEDDVLDPRPFPAGWLEYLTRPYRRLLLVAGDKSSVSHVYRKAAVALDKEWRAQTNDPWVAYRVTDKGERAIALDKDKALWRDSHALIQHLAGRDQGAPGYVNILARLNFPAALHAFGVVADNNKIDLWRHERLPLPATYLIEPDLLVKLQGAIELAESVGRLLGKGTYVEVDGKKRVRPYPLELLARTLLFPDGQNIDFRRTQNLVRALKPERPYWAALDAPFRTLLADLAEGWSRREEQAPLRFWAGAVGAAATEAFESAARSLETSGRGLRAGAEARGRFNALLRSSLDNFLPIREETRV